LDLALKSIPRQTIPGVLVGYENSDDAGVYQLTPDVALVQTVDYFSPIVDDAYTYGQIAAANSLSDVYAMGGDPKTALSIVGFPTSGLDFSILGDIMRGGLDKLNEAGVALLGGHSVRDDEIKFGYAVTGVVDKKNIKQNNGAHEGNRLILTKALGTGLITTALKKGKASAEHVQVAVAVMSQLNRTAAQTCLKFRVDAMTDITGFGLAGHALEVAKASNLSIQIDHRKLPILPGALQYSLEGFCAGGLNSNREFFGNNVHFSNSVPADVQNILFDPQTSGGLLIFSHPDDAGKLLLALREAGVDAVEIGAASSRAEHLLTLT
jgi:selenide, water dikinase